MNDPFETGIPKYSTACSIYDALCELTQTEGGLIMGRKKRKCRAWQRQMRTRSKHNNPYRNISPGRLVALADWDEGEAKFFYPAGLVNRGNGGNCYEEQR